MIMVAHESDSEHVETMYKSIQQFIKGNDVTAFDYLLGQKNPEKTKSGPRTPTSKRQMLLHQMLQSILHICTAMTHILTIFDTFPGQNVILNYRHSNVKSSFTQCIQRID